MTLNKNQAEHERQELVFDAQRMEILKALRDHGPKWVHELERITGLNKHDIRDQCEVLRIKGDIKHTRFKRYSL